MTLTFSAGGLMDQAKPRAPTCLHDHKVKIATEHRYSDFEAYRNVCGK